MSSKTPPPGSPHKLVWEGKTVKIWAIGYSGNHPAYDFIEKKLSDGDKTKLLAIFQMVDEKLSGFRNPQKFKKLGDFDGMCFMEFKSFQVRIGCFWQPGYNIFMTHGFIKKKDDWPPGEIQRLRTIYAEWQQPKEDGDGKKKKQK